MRERRGVNYYNVRQLTGLFDWWEYELKNVNKMASVYTELLSGIDGLAVPVVEDGFYSSWAQYAIQLPTGADREAVRRKMAQQGI